MVHSSDPQDVLDKQAHKDYRSGVGMLLWLLKHSNPDKANSVCELTKVLDSPSKVSYKEMLQFIKYVLDTKHYGLYICPKIGRDLHW